jgi:hypothetical protein
MKTKITIFLFIVVSFVGCNFYNLNENENLLCGRWKICVLDSCAKNDSWTSILKDKGIFYFHSDLTCDVKRIDRNPFLFGKTFFWKYKNESFEMYNENYIFLTKIYMFSNDKLELEITLKDDENIKYDVILEKLYY